MSSIVFTGGGRGGQEVSACKERDCSELPHDEEDEGEASGF